MLLSQVFSPFAYAVTGEETPVPEAVVEEPITPEEDNGDEVETSIWETLSEEESQQEKQQEPETITQDVVVVNSWDYQWTDWEKIQNGSWNLENNHESATVVIDSWTIVDDMSCDIIELSWWNENIEEKYDEKTENLTWIDSNSWIMETIKNFLWLWESKEEEKEQKNYEYESQVITWEAEYDDVKVEVYADTWLFYSWTELLIQAVTGDMYEWVKEVLSWQLESISEEEQTVVAFDISFIYSWEEVQPLTWRVQVKFNYENNEDFKAAEEDEEREVKVYHLNDKDGEWNKIEELTWTTIEEVIINEEKSEEENVLVVEAESFSVYTIVKQVIEEQLISFQYWMISIANPLNPSQWITIMDRNLWATITWAWNNAPKESYGYHYQWWNNYWFDSNESSTEISTSSSTIDVSELSEYYGSTFIVWNTSWMSSFKNLWWEWWQWPCPEWRHVPKYTERESLVSYYNNTYTNSWVNGFTSYFKLPYAWYREHSYWWFSNAARKFWTSQKSPSNNQRARIFYLYNDSEIRTTYINDMAYWYSIRCFKNNYESIGEDDLYNEVSFVLNWWKWSVMQTMILSWELLVRPADPVREYRIFSGWYLSWENVEFDFLSRNITENITLYAKWKCVEWYESYGDSCKRISNWKTAILKKWSDFNKIIKSLAKWYDVTSEWTSDVLITKILREEEKKQWENTIISVENSEYPVYVWYENWAIKYFSEAWTIYMNEDSSDMFTYLEKLRTISFEDFDTSKVTNMRRMFYLCKDLLKLNLESFDMSKVTNMADMFRWCSKLESLDIWWWDTNNVTSMNSMFNWCNSLKSLDIWWFDTSSVTDMSSMFQWCNSLTGLDLSSFVTTNVYYLNSMFYDASLLEKIYVSDRFRITNNLYSSYSMFYWATSIVWWRWTTYNWSYTDKQYAIIDEWPENPWYFTRKWWVIATLLPWQEFNAIIKTLANGNSVSYSSIDYEIEKITTWSLSQMENIDSDKKVRLSTISSEVPVYWWFDNSSKTLYYYSEADTIDMNPNSSYMFSYLAWLKTIDFDRIKTSSVGNMENMFFYSTSLKYLDLSNFDTSSVKNMNSMFRWCSNLESLNLDWWNLKLLQSASNWNWFFKETPKLKRVSMRGWEIPSSFNDWISRTWWASTIEEVDVTDWDLSRTKNISWLFWSSTNLKRIIWLNTWDISRITSMSYLFQWCSNLESLNMDWWNFKWFSYLNNISGVFDGATKLSSLSCKRWKLPKNSSSWLTSWYWTNIQTIDVTDWNLSNTEDISSLFYLSNATQIVWLNTWDISNIKSMNYMFENMRNLKSIDLSNWNMKNLQTMYSLFNWCINLEIVKLDWWNFKNVQGYSQMFYDTPKLKVIQSSWWQLPNSFSNWLCRNGSASSVEIVDVTNWNLSWTNNIDGLFADCQNLTGLIWFETRKNTNNLVTIGSMFQNTKLEEIDFWNFDSSNIVNMYWLFFKSDRLRTIKIGKLNTQNVKNMSKMFYWLESLVSLDLSSFDTSNVVEMNEMFKWSNKLKTIYVSSSFKTDKVMSSSDMFSWTLSLIWWNWTRYDLNHIDVEYARIDSWDSLWYFTNPNRLSVRFITTTWVELLKQWISTWSTVDNLKDGHRIYRYYISSDLQTWFDFTKPLYWYTEIYVTRDDVKYVTYDYWTWVKKFSIYTWSCVVENWEDKSQESESCEVDLPGIYVLTWYHTPMWYKKWTEITYTNDKITLTWDEELEAKAIANHYTISYNSWTWTWEMESQEFVYDEEWILNENRFEKAGYYFTEWIDENWNTYKNKEKILNLLTTWSIELTVQRSLIPPAAWWGQSIIPAPKEQEHNAAEEKQEEKQESNQDKQQEEQSKAPEKSNTSNQTTTQQSSSSSKDNIVTIDPEIQTAYEWAYKHNITTISSLDDANPDWTVTRGHLAKMVVNYATNVLWREIPEEIPSECRWNDWRKDWESEEIKDYAVKSCALWLMWLDMPKFLPNLDVTRAQFGTIMSRLLWWKKYAWWTPYYRKHLNALKENNIMIQIQNPEKRIELRQWVWVMLMRSSENK